MYAYRIVISLLLVFCLIPIVGYSQLQGIYTKAKNRPTSRTNSYAKNSHFIAKGMLGHTSQKSKEFLQLSAKYSAIPPQVDDCVFFTPLNNYIESFSEDETISNYFVLNHCYTPLPYPYRKVLPYSLRMFLDTSNVSVNPGQLELLLDSGFCVPLEEFVRPFYFRKLEVSNAEYREFVHYVRDSIARTILFEAGEKEFGKMISVQDKNGQPKKVVRLNWEPEIPWDLKVFFDSGFMKHDNERFYKRDEVCSKKLKYSSTHNDPKPVSIYPDTTRWLKMFTYSYNEPMTNAYFWHPAYADYPVVGVSYWQALAYLDWRSKMHQKELDREEGNWNVKYDLPADVEWEVAMTYTLNKKQHDEYPSNYKYLADQSWICDLKLMPDPIPVGEMDKEGNQQTRGNQLFNELHQQHRFVGNYVADGSIFTHPCNIHPRKEKNELILQNRDQLGICFMAGNVSEWLKDSYPEQWKPIFEMRQQQLATVQGEDIRLLKEIEAYYNTKNDPNGKLVRGTNWYDERFSQRLGKNTVGAQAKTFAHPDSSFCTVGFRYVVRFEEKE